LHFESEKEIVRRFQTEKLVAARTLAREIELYLRDRAHRINMLSSFPSLQNSDMNEMAVTVQKYFEYLKKNHVKAISVYDEKGTIIHSTTKEAIGRSYAEFDFFQWAAKKENKGKQFISSLIQKTDNKTEPLPNFRFLIAAPIYREVKNKNNLEPADEFVGIVTSTIDLEEVISAFLPLVSPHANQEHTYIFDKSGTLLFHSEHPEEALRNIRSQDKTCFKCHVSFEHIETILNEKQGTTKYQLKDKPKKLASYSSIEFKNISWKIVISIPHKEVSGFINRHLFITLILIGVITLTFIGGSSLIYRSNRLKIRAEEEAKQWMAKRELENKIRESEEHYRTVVDISPDSIVIHCEGKIVFVNPAAVKLVGASSAGDLIGKSAIEFVHPDERESIGKRILEILKNGKSSPWMEERFIKLDGSIIYVETVGTPTTYNSKPSVQVIIHDITERKYAEEALRQSENLFRSVWDNSKDGMRLSDENGLMVMVNQAFCIFIGKSREELEGKSLADVYELSDRERILKSYIESYSNNKLLPYLERKLNLWNGEEVRFAVSTAFLQTNDPRPLVLSIFRDITERKRAEEELHRKDEHHKAVIENIFKFIPEGVLVLTESLNLLKHNKAFDDIVQKYAPLLGYTEEELAQKIIEQLRSRIVTCPPHRINLGRRGGDSKEIHIGKKDQSETDPTKEAGRDELIIQYNTARMFLAEEEEEEEEEEASIVVSLMDVTEQKRAEEKVKVSLKEEEVLLQEIHHRVKNNLQVISSLLDMQVRTAKDKNTIEMLSESRNRINAMALIHAQLYETINFSEVNMKGFVDALIGQLFQSYPVQDAKITPVVHVTDYPLPISMATPIGLVLNELLTNAFKYAFAERKKGEIKVSLDASEKGKISLTVSDDGVGLPQGFNIDKSETLGLKLVKILVEEQLQGNIEIISKKGTTFMIEFEIENNKEGAS
ncbi:MAG: PAS domain S-box protein, partial [Bacteroidetes bacterium]|nr:PAS domain S-box protein [Bacteroidota bacterium]